MTVARHARHPLLPRLPYMHVSVATDATSNPPILASVTNAVMT